MRIALDVDNTLAATLETVVARYNREHDDAIAVEEFESWNFRETPLSYDQYTRLADAEWAEPTSVAAIDPAITDGVRALDAYGDVDIVTAREGRTEEIQRWLDQYGIRQDEEYGEFIVEDYKVKLRYDLFIDDNPMLAAVVPTISVPQPYNADSDAVARAGWTGADTVPQAVETYANSG